MATNSDRYSQFADAYDPPKSLKFLQKVDHRILSKLMSNMANVCNSLSMTTVVLQTANSDMVRCT